MHFEIIGRLMDSCLPAFMRKYLIWWITGEFVFITKIMNIYQSVMMGECTIRLFPSPCDQHFTENKLLILVLISIIFKFKEMVHWNVENGQITPLQIAENINKMSKLLLKPLLMWGIN